MNLNLPHLLDKTLIWVVMATLILQAGNLSGQEKYEKEYRIDRGEVPAYALQFIDSMQVATKIRWYMEESLTGRSVEAKFKYQARRYSLEFDTLGNLQDVEIEKDWEEIPEDIKPVITKTLQTQLERVRIIRVQVQYTGNEVAILTYLTGGSDMAGIITKYEIEVRGRKGNETNIYEYTFFHNGELEQVRRVVQRSSDVLEF